jgi:SLT domain-containing protein
MAQNPFEKALADEGLVGTPLESLARSIYMQESGAGKNTKTSNAGAVGGMQILPGTFNQMLPGGDINNPYDNSRAGLRYIKQMYNQSGGDLNLTAAGYYGGPGGMQKAKQGVAVSDPRNPNAPTTLEYAKQVTERQNKVSRETPKAIQENIANLGQGYQAAYALMSMADEEPETEREREAKEAAEEQTAAQQFANMQKQLASIKPATPFAAQEPQEFNEGGEAVADDDEEVESAKRDFQMFLQKATREESPLDVKFMTPDPRPMVVEGMGLMPAAPASVQGRVGYNQDGFRMGASGVATKTPQGVKVMPGMYDVGYKMPVAGGELDLNYTRGMKTMPGMKTPQMANIRYTKKFEKGGEAKAGDNQGSGFNIERWIAKKIGVDQAWDKSLNAPAEMGLSEDSGTRGDAVRHMTLMREIEKKYNPTVAKTLGYAHELIGGPMQYFTQGNAQSSRDREMDLRNNAVGLELSKQAGGDDAKFRELMAQALESKKADFYREEYTGKRKAPGSTAVRKRAEGSPEEGETKSTAKDMLKEVGRSAQYLPYDLIGAPVDVVNLGLKGIDYVTGSKLATEKPVGGSDYLIEKSRQMGIADKPTGSMTESLTRLATGIVSPTAGPRAVVAAGKAVKGTAKAALEDLSMATTGQGGSKVAQMLTSQAQPMFAVRPKGGVYLGAQSAKDTPLTRPDFDLKETIDEIDQTTDQGKAVAEFIDKKVRKYIQTQQGTPDDPIFKGIVQGRIEPQYVGDPEMLARARAGDKDALFQLRRRYDSRLGMTNIVPESVAKERGKGYAFSYTNEQEKLMKQKVQEQSPGEDVLGLDVRPVSRNSMKEFDNLYNYPGVDQLLKETESGKLLRMLNQSDLPPHIRQAAMEGEPISYQFSGVGGFGSPVELGNIKDYLNTRTPAEIKNMGVADVVSKSQEWHRTMAEARKDPSKFSRKQLMQGTQPVLPASKDMTWVDVKDSDALSLEGNIMGHCVGGSNYCSAVNKGTTKIISLRDKKGFPHVTIELTANDKGVFDKVSQVKGTANNSPEKYFQQVDEFLTDYSAKLGEPLRITERPSYLPEKWRK